MQNMRRAEKRECEILTNLSAKSEAYWGYDSDFMENFKSTYKVTEEFIEDNPTFVMEEGNNIIGFYSIIRDEKETSLEYFYIEPEKIGKGYGRLMWNHMTDFCKAKNIDEIFLVTSPQAKEFYIKMGAVLFGEVGSLVIKDRKIPKLVYKVDK